MAGEIMVLVTCPATESEKLARALVEERLAACVNIVDNVRSIYLWKGNLCNETEHLLVIKSNRSVWAGMCATVRSLHPYEVPEIIALPIEEGSKQYMEWLNSCINSKA